MFLVEFFVHLLRQEHGTPILNQCHGIFTDWSVLSTQTVLLQALHERFSFSYLSRSFSSNQRGENISPVVQLCGRYAYKTTNLLNFVFISRTPLPILFADCLHAKRPRTTQKELCYILILRFRRRRRIFAQAPFFELFENGDCDVGNGIDHVVNQQ